MSLLDSPVVQHLAPAVQIDLLNTSGRPFGLIDIRIVDDADTILRRVGDVGEVQINGPTVFTSYFNNPEATQKAFTEDGWFRNGDIARIMEHGYIVVCDRCVLNFLRALLCTVWCWIESQTHQQLSPWRQTLSNLLASN